MAACLKYGIYRNLGWFLAEIQHLYYDEHYARTTD
jgi:hypothetical protein